MMGTAVGQDELIPFIRKTSHQHCSMHCHTYYLVFYENVINKAAVHCAAVYIYK